MITIKNILVATDFGPASDNALRYGRALARRHGAQLHVLHVTQNIYLTAATAYGYAGVPCEAQVEIERAACTQTEALLTDEDRRDLRAVATTVTDNAPAMAVVEYARNHRIDLLVLGHARPRRAVAFVHGQRGGTGRPDGALPGAHGARLGARDRRGGRRRGRDGCAGWIGGYGHETAARDRRLTVLGRRDRGRHRSLPAGPH